MSKKYLRKAAVSVRYGVTNRSIERMTTDGRLPPPDRFLGKCPLWDEAKLDAADKAATVAARPRDRSVAA
jgi:hypothetical protein